MTAASVWRGGDVLSVLSVAKAAATARCEQGTPWCPSLAGMQLALLLANVRRLDLARRVVRRSAAAVQDPVIDAIAAVVNARIALCEGRTADATELCDQGMRLADDLRLLSWAGVGNVVRAVTALRRGELVTMSQHADQLKEDVLFGRDVLPWNSPAWLIVQVTEADKGRDAAVPLARQLLESAVSTRSLLLSEPTSASFLVRMLLRADDRKTAVRGRQHAAALAAENPGIDAIRAAALHVDGLVDRDPHQLEQAAATYRDPWARASANEDIGNLLGTGGGECGRVRSHYELAMRYYDVAGSPRDSSRVRSKLRGHDIVMAAPGYWPPSRIPILTDTEYAVAELVAGGLTNPEVADRMFLSRHTVAFHLRKIFQKIGTKSRIELALRWKQLGAAARNGSSPPPAGRVGPGQAHDRAATGSSAT
ncbi:helix-turn-helix transcriptional regulator [Micromonospora sp. NBS 11-29]|uniref:helix-turn-helix transcriptional regulator n=1 Tax=Micromonospora sp. NBS 11-29 TaxID=1960879 RepID=UPI00111F5ED5|nr:helix-turn-helix transcriptional regulator [Micromonospora sp. NBS 11-29]